MASQKQRTVTIDKQTGEVMQDERIFTSRYKTQPFVSISLPVSGLLHSVLNKDGRVLLALAELAEFNTNTTYLIASKRQHVMRAADVSSSQLTSILARLRGAKVISGGKGEAIIHPSVLWKGDTATKNNLLADLAKSVTSTFE